MTAKAGVFPYPVLAGARIPHWDGPHVCAGGPVWSAVTQPLGNFYGLAYGNGIFVATGHGQADVTPTPTMFSTTKGKTWQAGATIPNQSNQTPFSMRFGDGLFVAWGNGLTLVYTADDTSWSVVDPGVHIFSPSALEFGNHTFVIVDQAAAQLAVGTIAGGFVSITPPAPIARCWWDSVRSRWLLIENGGVRCWTTTDFVTFTQRGDMPQDGATVTPYNIAQSSRTGTIALTYLAGISTVSYTDDGGDTWVSSSALPVNNLQNLLFGNGIFIAVGTLGGYTLVSTDNARTWFIGSFLTTEKSWITAYNGKNSYAAVGSSGGLDTVANVGDC